MYTICKEYTFSAAHHIDTLPDDHPCKRPHGHNYKAQFYVLCDELNEHGFVMDFRELDACIKPIIDELDHRDLNVELMGKPTTSEFIAMWLFYRADARISDGDGIIINPDDYINTDEQLAVFVRADRRIKHMLRVMKEGRKAVPRLMRVRVSETDKTWVEYTR